MKAGDMGGVVTVLLRAFQTSLLQTYKSKFTQARARRLTLHRIARTFDIRTRACSFCCSTFAHKMTR
jgi:hypothetical protein